MSTHHQHGHHPGDHHPHDRGYRSEYGDPDEGDTVQPHHSDKPPDTGTRVMADTITDPDADTPPAVPPDSHPDTDLDTRADTDPDATTGIGAGPVWGTSDSQPAASRAGEPEGPGPEPGEETEPGAGAALEGRIVATGADASGDPVAVELAGPPEPRVWRWAVGWRHKVRRLWAYKGRYARNTALILAEWGVHVIGWWFRGIARAARDFFDYLDDRQALAVADMTAGGADGRADVAAWLKARSERHREVRDRRAVVRARTILPLAALLVVVLVAVWLGASAAVRASVVPGLWVAWVGAGCWLVWYGRSRTAPFWPAFREPSPYPPVTADTVTAALLATGITQLKDLVKAGRSPIEVIYRDDTAGGKVAEVLPVPGVTTEMLTAKSLIVAGGMKRPPAMVHISQADSGVPGNVEVLFLDIDPGTTRPRRFAYLGKPVNVGRACTIGYDPRNRPVTWALPGRNTIVTGTPGSGKTAFLLGLGCLVAADADGAQLALFDFKGMGDYAETEPVAYAYAADPDTTETARALREFLHAAKADIARRRKVLTQLKASASDLLDNNAAAVTDRLARTRRYGLAWTLVIIDEFHEAVSDPVYGKEIVQLVIELMKIGRAVGVHFVIATQRTDAESIPTSISSLPVVRVAFHQNGQNGNDQILGTGAYKRGVDATAFRRGAEGSKADDRGTCWYIGSESGQPVRTRTTFVLPDAKRIITHSVQARQKAGTLTGAAAGITPQPATPSYSALADVRAAFTGDEDALHGDVIFHRVNTRHPGRWKSQHALIAALKAEAPTWPTRDGTPTLDVARVRPTDAPDDPGEQRTRKGIRLEHLTQILTGTTTTGGPAAEPGPADPDGVVTDGDAGAGTPEAA